MEGPDRIMISIHVFAKRNKKIAALLLAAAMTLSLGACGSTAAAPEPTAEPTAAPTAAPTPEPTPVPTPTPTPEPPEARAYREAEELLESGDTAHAAMAFYALGEYEDARERSFALWNRVAPHNPLAVGYRHTVAITNSGALLVTGKNEFHQCEIPAWEGVVSLAAANHTVGLMSDGTVRAVGKGNFGQCDVDDWTDVVAISAGENNTLGLRADGTVLAAGHDLYGQCAVADWTDVIAVSAGNHSVALRADGTALAVGDNQYGQCDISDWTDLVCVISAGNYTFGVRADGTVLQAGYTGSGAIDLSDWKDVVSICYGAGAFVLGMTRDGTLLAAAEYRDNKYGHLTHNGWTDIVAYGAGVGHTVGLRSDGTLIANGHNGFGQGNVKSWTDVRMPGT